MTPDERLPAALAMAARVDRGACRAYSDTGWWFSDRALDIERAKTVCAGCPVLDECRAYAMQNERYHTWAGMTEDERQKARRAKGLGILQVRPATQLTPEQRLARLGHGRGAYRAGLCRCAECLGAHNAYSRALDQRRRLDGRHRSRCSCADCVRQRAIDAGVRT